MIFIGKQKYQLNDRWNIKKKLTGGIRETHSKGNEETFKRGKITIRGGGARQGEGQRNTQQGEKVEHTKLAAASGT